MDIVDFHVHAGDFFKLRDDIQGLLKKFPLEQDITVESVFSNPLDMKNYLKRNGVTKAVILAECGPGTNFSIDSQMIVDFCKNDPFFVPFGNINPNHHDPVKECAVGHKLGVQGYKFYPADHGFDPYLPGMMDVYAHCERYQRPVMFHTGLSGQRDALEQYIQPKEFEKLARTFPNLNLIFAHSGKPHWFADAADMACRYRNVFLDTALVPPTKVAELLREYRPLSKKILFGSDWPVCGAYSTLFQAYSDLLTQDQLRDIAGRNAEQLLSLSSVN